MKTKKKSLLLFLLGISLLSACSMEVSKVADTAAPAAGIITATLYPTFTPRATATPMPATAIPTVEPVSGTVSAQINIRQSPSTASESVGMLGINSKVWIIGKDAQEKWYQIYFDFPDGERGEGWGAANYIQTAGKPDVPVVSSGGASTGEEDGNGIVTQQINIRTGPGISFDALGILNIGDGVTLIGKNPEGTWLKIEYASGEAWVFAAYIESDVIDDLPIPEDAVVMATEIAATAAPVYTPAPDDGDSMEEPAIFVEFSTNDSRAFSYASDLSSPEGDAEDWVAFHPNSTEDRVNLSIDLSCEGNGTLYVELWQGGVMLTEWGELKCGDTDYALSMFRDETYQFRLFPKYSSKLQYISYNLQVRAVP